MTRRNSEKRDVLVVGTGTIGEPLIGLLCSLKDRIYIRDVYFYKRTPLRDEVAKVDSLIARGGKLVVKDLSVCDQFLMLGHKVSGIFDEVLEKCDIIIDCTPAGNRNKKIHYTKKSLEGKTFIAQGSEKGFGTPYAYGINDEALETHEDKFIQIVSCNTHNIACLIDTLGKMSDGKVQSADFVCIRRANDVSQDDGAIGSPVVGDHPCELGTHHAEDVTSLLATKNVTLPGGVFSSAMKTNSQYMHVIRFNINIEGLYDRDEVIDSFRNNQFIALTHRSSVNRVFSFGRDHGFYGRIYNQTVIPFSSVNVRNFNGNTIVTGFCFTPQDGNSLLSSTAAIVRAIHGEKYKSYMTYFDKLLYNEI